MESERLTNFIEDSFLSPLIKDRDITDISYNGKNIFYLHNYLGRKKSEIEISENDVRDFIRQIANLSEKQFSYQCPKLDVSVGRFRINAIHPSIGRRNNAHCLTFSLRITSDEPIITDQSTFLNAELISLFQVLLNSGKSIIIGGVTGCGKTEFQKYLISKLKIYSRIIVIDNVLELDSLNKNENLDLNIWQADEKSEQASIQELVRNALRSNPDWLIVAESRGKEMIEVLNSAMTGHPIITTLHAFNVDMMPTRIARMVLMNEQKQDFNLLMQDIHYNLNYFIYLKRNIESDGKVKRFIQEVSYIDEQGKKYPIYLFKKNKPYFYRLPKSALDSLIYEDEIFIKTFTEENYE